MFKPHKTPSNRELSATNCTFYTFGMWIHQLAWAEFTTVRTLAALPFLTLMVYFAVACADSDQALTEILSPTNAEPAVVTTSDVAIIASKDRSANGGVLIYAATCGIPDPAISPMFGHSIYNGPMVSEIHAGLTRIGRGSKHSIETELAESYLVEDDGKIYTFKLRNDLRFSDGSPLMAADFKYSWERALIKSRAGGSARFTFEPIKGYQDVIEGKKDELEGVQVVDNRTLVVRLSAPVAHFLMLLASPAASVVKQENVEKWGVSWTSEGAMVFEAGKVPFPELPVGAGPFRLTHYDLDRDECQISRNDHYWGDAAHLDGVVFHTETKNRTNPVDYELKLFQQGEIDNILWAGRNSEDSAPAGKEVSKANSANVSLLLLNPTIPPFDDVHARRAIAMITPSFMAEDEQARIFTVYTSALTETVARLPFSPENAHSELRECGCQEAVFGRTIEFVTGVEGGVAQLVFPLWKSHLDISVWTNIDHSVPDLVWNNSAELVSVDLEYSFPDPATVFMPLLDAIPGGRDSSLVAEFRDLAESAYIETDSVQRLGLWNELEQRMLDSGVVLPVGTFSVEPSHVQEWVYGFESARFGRSVFHDVWLEDPPYRTLK